MQLQKLLESSNNSEVTTKMMESKTIPSTAIQNRSFLHGEVIGEKYVTIDSVALRRTSLPLQLVPTDINLIDEETDVCPDNVATPYSMALLERQSSFKVQLNNNSSSTEATPVEIVKSDDDLANKADTDTEVQKDAWLSWEKIQINCEREMTRPKRRSPSNAAGKFVVKPKWTFTRSFLHYVPKQSKRSKKLTKTSTKNIDNHEGNRKNVDWPRRSVSVPTGFVHVAGITKWSWLQESDFTTDSAKIITHKEKCATLTLIGDKQDEQDSCSRSSSVETLVNDTIEEPVKLPTVPAETPTQELVMQSDNTQVSSRNLQANTSFLWSTIAKSSIDSKGSEKIYDDGMDEYDDVGPVPPDDPGETYDDVGLPETYGNRLPLSIDYHEDDDQVYDDVMPPTVSSIERKTIGKDSDSVSEDVQLRNHKRIEWLGSRELDSSDKNVLEDEEFIYMRNDYSSVDGDADNEDTVYDDVGVFCESRVNSIYAGSLNIIKMDPSKESEWEDLEESSSSHDTPKNSSQHLVKGTLETGKRKSGQRWTKKVRRQKSKASRRNSARSSSRVTRRSCNFSDSGSDDSNYETLCSFEPTESNGFGGGTWSPNSTSRSENSVVQEQVNRVRCSEAPSRPIPPPPRESSLTETLGKRMKILKRTWSITKGSLGRMRRRTSMSTETDSNVDEFCPKFQSLYGQNDTRKSSQVFNFKKHFQKSITSLSTFYFDNEDDITSSRNNNTSMDDIYGNSNCPVHSNYQTRQNNNTDDYNILAEEPLYQFYAAATVRGAFQSDSDSYEEAENSKLVLSTSDLGKPGYRTMWYQTPQVISSGLLERLTPDEKKLQEAKFEILTSEASYLNSLRVLVNQYVINHELVYEALSSSDREKLFGNVPSVLIASERLLAELEAAWRTDPMLRGLPDVLLSHAERCSKVYVDYCSNQVSIDLTLKELKSKKSSKFLETVARIEAHPACQSLSLHSFLMLPMQRVTRLPLLADAVLSKLSTDHEERLDWERVLSVLGRVVKECNEGARNAGRQIEMETLAKKIEYSTKVSPIDLRDRYLVRSGPVTQILAKPGSDYVLTFRRKYSKTPLYLLLLTDHLLVAKLKTNGQEENYSVVDSCKRSLVALEKVPDDSPFAGRYAMILSLLENHGGRHVEYILSCQNDTERERWLDAVSPPKPNVVGETLYETWDCPQVMALYSYTACQPDELSLQPGDVINVLRKMADGWNIGEKLVGGEQGWFPGNFTKEVASEHVRARNLRQRHRLLALSESLVQQRAKLTSGTNR